MWRTVEEIRREHELHGGFWFADHTMRTWGTRIENGGQVIGGRYFVTSEDNFDGTARLFTIRAADDSGMIDTVGEFQGFATADDAVAAARLLLCA